jgi:hypothetical protein
MPYTDKQRGYFGRVASGEVVDKNLSREEARKLLHEGKEKGWVHKLKTGVKKELAARRKRKM